jgi:hypothetical protein
MMGPVRRLIALRGQPIATLSPRPAEEVPLEGEEVTAWLLDDAR